MTSTNEEDSESTDGGSDEAIIEALQKTMCEKLKERNNSAALIQALLQQSESMVGKLAVR